MLVDDDGNYVDRRGRRVEPGDDDAVIRGDGPRGPRPGEGAGTNFDFEPGARTLFEDDFEGTRTGNVPGSIRFVKGEVEVVEDRGNKVLRVLRSSIFGVPMGERPDLFTVEFDLFLGEEGSLCITTTPIDEYTRLDRMYTCGQAEAWTDMASLNLVGAHPSHLVKTGFTAPSEVGGGTGEYGEYPALNERYVPVRATVDGTYLKVYLDETRVVNIPNVALAPGSELFFFVEDSKYRSGDDERYALIDNLRVGGRRPGDRLRHARDRRPHHGARHPVRERERAAGGLVHGRAGPAAGGAGGQPRPPRPDRGPHRRLGRRKHEPAAEPAARRRRPRLADRPRRRGVARPGRRDGRGPAGRVQRDRQRARAEPARRDRRAVGPRRPRRRPPAGRTPPGAGG